MTWGDVIAWCAGPAVFGLAWLWRRALRHRLRVQITSKHARFYTSFRPSKPSEDRDDTGEG